MLSSIKVALVLEMGWLNPSLFSSIPSSTPTQVFVLGQAGREEQATKQDLGDVTQSPHEWWLTSESPWTGFWKAEPTGILGAQDEGPEQVAWVVSHWGWQAVWK